MVLYKKNVDLKDMQRKLSPIHVIIHIQLHWRSALVVLELICNATNILPT